MEDVDAQVVMTCKCRSGKGKRKGVKASKPGQREPLSEALGSSPQRSQPLTKFATATNQRLSPANLVLVLVHN